MNSGGLQLHWGSFGGVGPVLDAWCGLAGGLGARESSAVAVGFDGACDSAERFEGGVVPAPSPGLFGAVAGVGSEQGAVGAGPGAAGAVAVAVAGDGLCGVGSGVVEVRRGVRGRARARLTGRAVTGERSGGAGASRRPAPGAR